MKQLLRIGGGLDDCAGGEVWADRVAQSASTQKTRSLDSDFTLL